MSSEYAAIIGQLQTYFDGLYHSDTGRLAKAFHPSARYVCATNDDLIDLGMDEYFPIVDARESPASRNEDRRDRVISIELAGPKTAFARVECAIANRHFIDLLTLIKADGTWRIIAKVFHYELVQERQT